MTTPDESDQLRQRLEELEKERELLELAFRVGQAGTTEEFARRIVVALTSRLNMAGAFVGRFLEPNRIETIAFWLDGEFRDNLVYDSDGTPCEQTMNQEVCCYPTAVAQQFPSDQMLSDLFAQKLKKYWSQSSNIP